MTDTRDLSSDGGSETVMVRKRSGPPPTDYPITYGPGTGCLAVIPTLPGRMGPHRLTLGQFSFFDSRLPARFWNKVSPEPMSGCWLWIGPLNSGGYSEYRVGTYQVYRGHRISYAALVGSIPDGLQLDHVCRTRSCVNPGHLEPVTRHENQLRGSMGLTTHCKRGHEFSPENTYVRKWPDGSRTRMCRQCNKIRHRRGWINGER